MSDVIRILGIDPGLRRTGWGVIEQHGQKLRALESGAITPDKDGDLAARLVDIFEALQAVIAEWAPAEAAIEKTFANVNAAATLSLGHARAAALLAPAIGRLTVGEYAPNDVKKSVVGVGHADKRQVQAMVKRLLPTARPQCADAADALAIAICHAHRRSIRVLSERGAA